jgi:hypothetical protein
MRQWGRSRVEHPLTLFGFDVGLEQIAQSVLPLRTPRELFEQHGFEGFAGIDGARVDGKAGGLQWKAAVLVGETALVSYQVHQIGRILAVVDSERRIEPNSVGVAAQQPCADRMEGA